MKKYGTSQFCSGLRQRIALLVILIFTLLTSCTSSSKSQSSLEADAENQKFWERLFTKCGDSYYGDVAPGHSQLRGVTFSTEAKELTPIDKENGYEWRGTGTMRFTSRRLLSFGQWGEWISTEEETLTHGKVTAYLNKKNGVWSAVRGISDDYDAARKPTCEQIAEIEQQQK